MRRLYWAACATLLCAGLAGAVLVVLFPPERYDQDGHLIAEMPQAFGAALGLAVLGAAGLLAGGFVWAMVRFHRWVRRGRKGA
ncbi:MAG TPA: hypothetical protein VD995_32025 [Azospirillum sp.]|nr:hypothetical protein [Azospirillum sp.]